MGESTGKRAIERMRVFAAVERLVYLLLAGVDQSQAPDDGGQTKRSEPYLWASMCLRLCRAGSLMRAVVYTKLFCVSFVFYC